MDISKTEFKRYCKCDAFYSLDKIYYTHSLDIENRENVIEMLHKMFGEDGEDLIKIPDQKLEAMLCYYQEVERLALEEASKLLGKPFEYKEKTKEQKSFSITDTLGNTFYTYVDGYYEDENEIIIIEAKASTSKKYLELGYTEKKVLYTLFEKNDNLITLRKEINEKYYNCLKKLYDKDTDVGKYMYDLGITKYIVSQSLKKKSLSDNKSNNKNVRYYLALLNSSYIKDMNDEKIICFIDATDILNSYDDIIQTEYNKLIKVLNNPKLNKESYKKICKDCEYFKICHERLTEKNSILKLISSKSVNKVTIEEMVNSGLTLLKDIPYENLENVNHIIQRNAIDTHTEYINKNNIKDEINKIEYPIYHLDFEGFNCPIPRFRGEKPYTQSLFQFSIHVERKPGVCDRDKDCYSFLPHDFEDHREDLIKELIKVVDLSNGGSVMVYNKSYESPGIKNLIDIFPNYEKELTLINSKIVDLLEIVKGKMKDGVNYYHEDLEGSFSIKKVLPVFSNLTYKDLDVKNGNEAIVAYSTFKYLPKEDIEEIRKNLLKYCGLDTYSMFVILDELRRRIK